MRAFLVVLALAILPGVGGAADDTQVIKTRNLEQLVGELADWSQPHAGPGEYRVVHKVSFCQKRTRGVAKVQAPSCRQMLYAMGVYPQPAYIQINAAPGSEVPRSSGDWYPVSPEWSERLWKQFRNRTSWLDEYLVFRSAEVDKQVEQVADWSRKIASPASHRKPQRVLFCQLPVKYDDETRAGSESCYILLHKRGGYWTPGYVQVADSNGAETTGPSGHWFRLTPEWDKTLKTRMRNAQADRSMFPEPSPSQPPYPPYPSDTYSVIPGNRWDDPRYEERKDK